MIEAAPDSVRYEDSEGHLPLHQLCVKSSQDETSAMAILRLLLEKYPESIRHAAHDGNLPIHAAAMASKSPEFCHVLIAAYPGSERITDDKGMLPFHDACANNSVDTVEYLYDLYPDAIDHVTSSGHYPINLAICNAVDRQSDPRAVVEFQKAEEQCLYLYWHVVWTILIQT